MEQTLQHQVNRTKQNKKPMEEHESERHFETGRLE